MSEDKLTINRQSYTVWQRYGVLDRFKDAWRRGWRRDARTDPWLVNALFLQHLDRADLLRSSRDAWERVS